MLSRDTRNEKKLKALRRAQFSLKQRFERIDWEEDELLPEINDFKAKAQLPELPASDLEFSFVFEEDDAAQD